MNTKLSIYLWLPLYIFGIIIGFRLGENYSKAQIVKEALSKIPDIQKGGIVDLLADLRHIYK